MYGYQEITFDEDMYDLRDILARFRELEDMVADPDTNLDEDETAEHARIYRAMEALASEGGAGNLSPIEFFQTIADDEPCMILDGQPWVKYVQDLYMETHEEFSKMVERHDGPFAHVSVDWEALAEEESTDWTQVDVESAKWWVRMP